MANIVFWYVDYARKRYPATFQLIDSLKDKYNIHLEEIQKDEVRGAYRVLKKYWNKGEDIMLIDQDMLPTENDLVDILKCEEPYGCQGYFSLPFDVQYSNSGDYPEPVVRYRMDDLDKGMYKKSEFWGTGFTKIRKEIQLGDFEITDFKLYTKWNICADIMIYDYLYKTLGFHPAFHIHGKIKHLHTPDNTEWDGGNRW
jgi:hypothetical protein